MPNRLIKQFPELFQALASELDVGPEHVGRLEIDKKGGLRIEYQATGETTWLAWDGLSLKRLDPSRDRRLPAARLLNDAQVELLSYRPRKRMVLLDRRNAVPVIIKAFRPSYFRGIAQKYETAHFALTGRGIQTPDVVNYDSELACLFMLYDTVDPLHLGSDNLDHFHLLGESIAQFQAHESRHELVEHDATAELAILDQRVYRLNTANVPLPSGWSPLRDNLGAAFDQLPEPRSGLCQRDLHDKQVLQHPHFLTLLDFDLLCRADVALDPANFLAHMRLRELQGVRDATMKSTYVCGKRLLEGLGRNREAGFWERLRFYQAATFARLALLYTLRPRWCARADDLTILAQRCLDDLWRVRADA